MTRKVQIEPGYPLPSFPQTTDPAHCPGCGSLKIDLVDAVFTSGQRIGVCKNCAANYIVEPATGDAT